MQYATELRQLKEYLMLSYKRLEFPLMNALSEKEHGLICDMWRISILRGLDEKFLYLTTKGFHNRQECYDALDELRHFRKQIINALEKEK